MHEIADRVEKLLVDEMNADVVTHVDPITVDGEEFERIQEIISDNLQALKISTGIQDLRVVKNQGSGIESILFQVPVSVEFQQKEKFQTQCSWGLEQVYPDCKVIIEFKSQMSMG